MLKHTDNSSRSRQRFTPRTLLEVKRISDPVFSPDGLRIAFVVTEADFEDSRNVSHIWITETALPETEHGEQSAVDDADEIFPPRQMTFSHDGEHLPKWSPDGKYLAFLSSRIDESEPIPEDDEEDEPSDQIWLLPVDGGEARKATSAKEGVVEYEWTPDSDELIFLTPEPRPQPIESVRKAEREHCKIDPVVEHDEKQRKQFWRVEAEERKSHLIVTLDYGVLEFALSPDGARLCYATNYSGEWNDYHRVDIWLLELESKSKWLLCDRFGSKYNLRWSPDGASIAFLSWFDPQLSYSRESLFQVPCTVDGGVVEPLLLTPPEFDLDISEFEWSHDENRIYAVAASGTGSEIVIICPQHAEKVAFGKPGERSSLGLNLEGALFAFVEETFENFPELKLHQSDNVVRNLTKLNSHLSESVLLPIQEVLQWQSGDGLAIEGVLTYPIGYQKGEKYPLIVQIHGGPKSRSTNTLRSYGMPPVWSSEGYMVLQPNFRGSEGYGNAFAIANRRDLGGGDYEDIMAGVDTLIERGLADPDRMGVMGGSYGGYMTNWIIGHTDRFRAAISMFGIFHLTTDYSNSDLSRWANDYMGAYYWEDPEVYSRLSPGTFLESMNTPTLIIHGDDDDNTYISNSKEMYQALRHRGVTTQFVHYPREKHGIREPNHRLDEIRRSLAWMDRFVLGGDGPGGRYRVGDKVPSINGSLELLVIKAEISHFLGHHEDKKPEGKSAIDQTSFLEIAFTIHNQESSDDHPPFVLALDDIQLTPETENLIDNPGEILTPIGVPLDLPGAKMLVEGAHLHIHAATNPETKRLSLACSVVFRVTSSSGESILRIPDFPSVKLQWSRSTNENEDEEE